MTIIVEEYIYRVYICIYTRAFNATSQSTSPAIFEDVLTGMGNTRILRGRTSAQNVHVYIYIGTSR